MIDLSLIDALHTIRDQSTFAPGMDAGAIENGQSQHDRARRRPEVNATHMVSYILVEASTHDEALSTGKTVFDRPVEADVCFDEDDTRVARKARWGELPEAAPVESEEGQGPLERGWEAITRSDRTERDDYGLSGPEPRPTPVGDRARLLAL